MVTGERVAARFKFAKSAVKEFIQQVAKATPQIEALTLAGDNAAAKRLYAELVEPIRAFTATLEGVVVHRKEEQRKLVNLKEVLRLINGLTRPNRFERPDDSPEEVGMAIRFSLETLAERLNTLSRMEARMEGYKALPQSFTHGPFTIVNKIGFRPEELEEPLKLLDAAAAKIQAAGYGRILYGEITLGGAKSVIGSVAGQYFIEDDTIRLNVEARFRIDGVFTMVHEFGHRFWYKFLSEAQRDQYEEAYNGTAQVTLTVKDREVMYEALQRAGFDPRKVKGFLPDRLKTVFPDYWKAQGASRRPSELGHQMQADLQFRMFVRPTVKFFHFESDRPVSVTDYGRTNVREDFAEVFAHFVMGQPLTPDASTRFHMVKTARSIVRRYLLSKLISGPQMKQGFNTNVRTPTLWFENEAGDTWTPPPDPTGYMDPPPPGFVYQHSRFPRELTETVFRSITKEDVDACGHGETKIDHGLIDGLEGRICRLCGGSQVKAVGAPWPTEWKSGGAREVWKSTSSYPADLVMAMCGRQTQEEARRARARGFLLPEVVTFETAVIRAATACERCVNALLYQYGMEDGYEEGSPQWLESRTRCIFCE